jgi:exonuclease III
VPREIRRGLPGDPSDREARYLEADVDGIVVASVYLPNGTRTGSMRSRSGATPDSGWISCC